MEAMTHNDRQSPFPLQPNMKICWHEVRRISISPTLTRTLAQRLSIRQLRQAVQRYRFVWLDGRHRRFSPAKGPGEAGSGQGDRHFRRLWSVRDLSGLVARTTETKYDRSGSRLENWIPNQGRPPDP